MTDLKPPGLDWTRFEEAKPEEGDVVIVEGVGLSGFALMWTRRRVVRDYWTRWRYPPVPAVQREAIEREVMAKVCDVIEDRAVSWSKDADEETGSDHPDAASALAYYSVAFAMSDLPDALFAAGLPVPGEGVGDG